jgi:hypothetical protein
MHSPVITATYLAVFGLVYAVLSMRGSIPLTKPAG